MTGESNWRGMFEQSRPNGRAMGGTPPIPPMAHEEPPDEDGLAIDVSVYRPWVLQRGRSRPVLMLDLRRFESKSGLWTGWAIAYPHLAAVEYVGERMLSLDFGARKFVLEGEGLRELTERLQQGSVLAIQEYCGAIWPHRPTGPFVSTIRRMGMENSTPPR